MQAIAADRAARLTDYQDATYSEHYLQQVNRVRAADPKAEQTGSLSVVVARVLHKLMAYKDEYEVARLYSDGAFLNKVRQQFDGDYELRFNLAPPLFSKRDTATGHLIKQEFGPWILTAFGWLAKLRRLRGSRFDLFGYTAERRQERADIDEYLQLLDELLAGLGDENYDIALELAALSGFLRGYGHVKDANRVTLAEQRAALLRRFRGEALAAVTMLNNAASPATDSALKLS